MPDHDLSLGDESLEARRVIVAVLWGPLHGRKAVIAPGETLRVGRGGLVELEVPHDRQMSASHFEISWDGARCRFRDLQSMRGTLVNGEAGRGEAELANGAWLKAGETVFTVHFEGATPPRGEGAREERAAAIALDALRACAAKEPLYAVLDAARGDRILELLREAVEEHRSLYEGVEGEALAQVAPYLVQLGADSRLLRALVREGWGRRWGIYFTSDAPFKDVRRHLRRFLKVTVEETGEQLYFRFYDPPVLAAFSAGSTPWQRTALFADMGQVLVEGEGGEVLRLIEGRGARQGC